MPACLASARSALKWEVSARSTGEESRLVLQTDAVTAITKVQHEIFFVGFYQRRAEALSGENNELPIFPVGKCRRLMGILMAGI